MWCDPNADEHFAEFLSLGLYLEKLSVNYFLCLLDSSQRESRARLKLCIRLRMHFPKLRISYSFGTSGWLVFGSCTRHVLHNVHAHDHIYSHQFRLFGWELLQDYRRLQLFCRWFRWIVLCLTWQKKCAICAFYCGTMMHFTFVLSFPQIIFSCTTRLVNVTAICFSTTVLFGTSISPWAKLTFRFLLKTLLQETQVWNESELVYHSVSRFVYDVFWCRQCFQAEFLVKYVECLKTKQTWLLLSRSIWAFVCWPTSTKGLRERTDQLNIVLCICLGYAFHVAANERKSKSDLEKVKRSKHIKRIFGLSELSISSTGNPKIGSMSFNQESFRATFEGGHSH